MFSYSSIAVHLQVQTTKHVWMQLLVRTNKV